LTVKNKQTKASKKMINSTEIWESILLESESEAEREQAEDDNHYIQQLVNAVIAQQGNN
jgi:hypothetical protein